MAGALLVLFGYVVGSLPWANFVAGRVRRIDLRTVGDRNPGYWNAKAQLGRRASIVVFVGDVLKGAIPVGVARAFVADPWWVGYLVAAAAMLGHAWPVFARFRGGRSILCFAGAMGVLAPLPTAVAVGALLVVMAATRRFDYAARVGVFGFPVIQAFFEPLTHVAACGGLMTIIGVRFAMAALRDRRLAGDQPG